MLDSGGAERGAAAAPLAPSTGPSAGRFLLGVLPENHIRT